MPISGRCPGALADALLRLAEGVQGARLALIKELRTRLLTLFAGGWVGGLWVGAQAPRKHRLVVCVQHLAPADLHVPPLCHPVLCIASLPPCCVHPPPTPAAQTLPSSCPTPHTSKTWGRCCRRWERCARLPLPLPLAACHVRWKGADWERRAWAGRSTGLLLAALCMPALVLLLSPVCCCLLGERVDQGGVCTLLPANQPLSSLDCLCTVSSAPRPCPRAPCHLLSSPSPHHSLAVSLSVGELSLDALNTAQEEDLLVLKLFRWERERKAHRAGRHATSRRIAASPLGVRAERARAGRHRVWPRAGAACRAG